jgi:flagellar motor switch protein FliN/FliY
MDPKLEFLENIPMLISIVFGTKILNISEFIKIKKGTILELDKLAGEPLDLYINNKLLARGEIVIINENYGVRLTDVVDSQW